MAIDVDYVILGAGIAGMTLDHMLRGSSTVLLDPAPGKYKIGESIIPQHFVEAEMRPLFEVITRLPSATPKEATLFLSDESIGCFPPFQEASYTIHVARQELEAATAEYFGTKVVTERVESVDVESRLVTTDRNVYRARKLIADCSGPARIVARTLGILREVWPVWASWAYHDVTAQHDERFFDVVRRGARAYYSFNDARRVLEDGGSLDGYRPVHCTTLTRVRDGAWTWQIPLYGARMLSLGVVSRFGPVTEEEYIAIAKSSLAPQYDATLRPWDRTGPHNSFHVRNRFAWASDQFAGESWALLGDAAFFGDPVYSIGTGFATNQAIQLGRLLQSGDWNATTAAEYHRQTSHLYGMAKRAYDHWYFGRVVADGQVASDIQTNFLNGRAFQVKTAAQYHSAWQVSYAQEIAEDLGTRGGPDVTADVRPLLDEAMIVGWELTIARAYKMRLDLEWKRPDAPPLQIVVERIAPGQPCYRAIGELGLSYRPPKNKTGKIDGQSLALLNAFATVVDRGASRLHALMEAAPA